MNTTQIHHIKPKETSLSIEIEQLRQDLHKVQSQLSELLSQKDKDTYLFVYASGEYRRVSVKEIIQIQSVNNYSSLYLDDGSKIFTSKTLKYWEESFNHADLIRVHHSNLINRNKIKRINVENSEILLACNLTAKYSKKTKSELLIMITK